MSDKPHTPHESHAPSESADAVEPLAASVRAAWAEWAELSVPPLPSDFTYALMLEVRAVDRAQAWESAFVPEIPADFAQHVAELAAREGSAHEALSAWRDAHVPALPEDFSATITAAALSDEAAREAPRREAFVAWSEQFVPQLPADFAAIVADAAMSSAQDELRTSGVIEKSAQLRAVTGGASTTSAPHGGSRGARRWIAPAAVSTFAAAAAAIFALVGSSPRAITPRGTDPTQRTTPPPQHTEPRSTVANHTPSQTGAGASDTTAPQGAAEEVGSEVEKVDVDGDRASFAAFSIQGEDDHSSVAVVWIDDGDKNPSEAPATL